MADDGHSSFERCLRFRARAKKNPRVQHVLAAIEDLGCKVDGFEELVACVSSDTQPGRPMTGGFAPHVDPSQPYVPKVIMIQENNADQTTFDCTLIHELVHAFDQCRAHVDWTDSRHLACAEIRASALSGECDFLQEFNRGKLGISKHHQACVRRRAALSVGLGHGVAPARADAAVASVYERCYRDTAPFNDDNKA